MALDIYVNGARPELVGWTAQDNCGTGKDGFRNKNKCGKQKGQGTPKKISKPEVTGKGRGKWSRTQNAKAQEEGFKDAEDKARFIAASRRSAGNSSAATELEKTEMSKSALKNMIADGQASVNAFKADAHKMKKSVSEAVQRLKDKKDNIDGFIARIMAAAQSSIASYKKSAKAKGDKTREAVKATPKVVASALVAGGFLSIGFAKYIWMSGRD